MTHAQPWSTGWAGAQIVSSNPIPVDELFLERTSHIMEVLSKLSAAWHIFLLNTELQVQSLSLSSRQQQRKMFRQSHRCPGGGGSNTKSRYLRRQLCYEFFNSKEILAFQKDLKAVEFKTLHGLCFLKCPIYIE